MARKRGYLHGAIVSDDSLLDARQGFRTAFARCTFCCDQLFWRLNADSVADQTKIPFKIIIVDDRIDRDFSTVGIEMEILETGRRRILHHIVGAANE